MNNIVTMFLDFAEDQARRRQTMTMKQWEDRLDAFLKFNDREVLTHAGSISHEKAEQLAHDKFDEQRRIAETLAAEEEYLQELETFSNDFPKKIMEDSIIRQAIASDVVLMQTFIFKHGKNPWNFLPEPEVKAHIADIITKKVHAYLAEMNGECWVCVFLPRASCILSKI